MKIYVNLKVLLVITIIFITAGMKSVSAEDNGELLDFDIIQQDSAVVVSIDLSPFLNSRKLDDINDGIDLGFEYKLTLERPKKLWGTEKIHEKSGFFKVGYRIITEDYLILFPRSDSMYEKILDSQARLYQYLADSINIKLYNINELDMRKRYVIGGNITCISLTAFNLTEEDNSGETESSPLKFLFNKFLEYTSYGREGYSFKSRPFSLSELSGN